MPIMEVNVNDNGWHLASLNEGLRLARVCNGEGVPADVESGQNNLSPTDDAWIRACRAINWRTAELRAHGIEPIRIPRDAPQYPPDWYPFDVEPKVGDGKSSDAALAIGEHAFRAGWAARDNKEGPDYASDLEHAWDNYDPPEDIKALS